jgi:hypothetical protein
MLGAEVSVIDGSPQGEILFWVTKVEPVLWSVKIKGYSNMMTTIRGGIRP